MTITIANLRGCKSATITPAKVTLIAGDNGNGKSSILEGISAAKSGKVLQIDGMTKSAASHLIYRGAQNATVSIEENGASCLVEYPESTRNTSGEFAEISGYAAGTESILDIDKKHRAEPLCKIVNGLPTEVELHAALEKSGVAEPMRKSILSDLKYQGWDGAHAALKETGARKKGRWEAITGQRYGSKKSEAWTPPAWAPELETADRATLEGTVKQEQEWLEAAIADTAVSAEAVAELEKQASGIDDLRAKHDSLRTLLNALNLDETNIKKFGRELPKAEQPPVVKCPHCQGDLNIIGVGVVAATVIPDDELAARKSRIEETADGLRKVMAEIQRVNGELSSVAAELKIAERAAEKLQSMKARPAETAGTSVETLRAKVAAATARLEAHDKFHAAREAVAEITQIETALGILAPSGLRQEVLGKKLTEFNSLIKSVCGLASWGTVEIQGNMGVTYQATPYMLLSKSEKWRTRVTLQIAIALMEKSSLIIIDDADILGPSGRNGLLRALFSIECRSIVAMTIGKKDQVPNLRKMGGSVYWVEKGVAEEVGE